MVRDTSCDPVTLVCVECIISGPQHNGTHLEDEEENKPPSLSDDDAEGTDDGT